MAVSMDGEVAMVMEHPDIMSRIRPITWKPIFIHWTLQNCYGQELHPLNPGKLDATIDNIIAAVKAEFQKKGLIK